MPDRERRDRLRRRRGRLSVVAVSANTGRVALSATQVEQAIAPMIGDAKEVFARYVAAARSRGVRPDAVVFIGGLANLPAVRAIAAEHELEVVNPTAPELVVATGAALLALQSYSGAARLAFIGEVGESADEHHRVRSDAA